MIMEGTGKAVGGDGRECPQVSGFVRSDKIRIDRRLYVFGILFFIFALLYHLQTGRTP